MVGKKNPDASPPASAQMRCLESYPHIGQRQRGDTLGRVLHHSIGATAGAFLLLVTRFCVRCACACVGFVQWVGQLYIQVDTVLMMPHSAH